MKKTPVLHVFSSQVFPWTAQLDIELNDPSYSDKKSLVLCCHPQPFNFFFFKTKIAKFNKGNTLFVYLQFIIVSLHSAVDIELNDPFYNNNNNNNDNNRYFGAVIHEIFKSFLEQKWQNLTGKTPSLHAFSS